MATSNVEERIVEMTFKNSDFAPNVSKTISALQSLKDHLHFKSEQDSLNSLEQAGSRFSLSGMLNATTGVAGHFNLMRIAGLTAFTTLVRQGLYAGESILKSLTIDPIKAGLNVYETKINAIQTILANTASAGTTLKQVTAALAQLNQYANLTVYNFGEMTRNIGTFTAAGVDLKTSVASIKGIANLAALSGSTSEQASSAMYQLSQAIAAGTVKLQDWNSVVNAGLGGKVFQNALIETARASGVQIDAIIKKAGSFRNSLQQGWLSSKILTETLSTFTGDLSLQQLKALGFTQKESEAILKQGKIALQSATQIRTVSQLTQALKEEVATAWASVWEAIIGHSGQAASTLSAFHNVAEAALTKPIYNLAHILQQFSDLGGRAVVIKTIENAFHALGAVLSTIGAGFREVFPSNGGSATSGLLKMARSMEQFTAAMTPSKKTLSELKTIFAGVFSVVKIGIDLIGGIVAAFSKVGGSAGGASIGILGLIAKVASAVTWFKNFIESGNTFVRIFQVIGTVLAFPVKLIEKLTSGMGHATSAAQGASSALSSFFEKIGNALKGFGKIVENALASGDLNNILQLFNQGIFALILLAIRKWFKGLGEAAPKKGLFDTIKESFEQLTGTLKTMQASLKSDILLKIASAVGILVASMVALSFINAEKLGKALAAISAAFIELLAATAIMVKISAGGGIFRIIAFAGALNLMATAVLILSAAVAILSRFSWTELGKGLGAIAILLLEFAGFAALTGGGKLLISTAISLNLIAAALNVMAFAVAQLGRMNVATLGKGIGSIAALLLILAGFNAISGKQSILAATALVIVGAALQVIAKAISDLGSLSWGTIGKGLATIAGSLVLIVLAMNLMPPTMIITAAGLVLVASALLVISKVMNSLGGMSWGAIARSLVELAGALAIITAAMYLMTGALVGAAALVVVAGALAILAPILVVLGNLSWIEIAKGLVALAGVFLILGLAGALLTPVVPTLLGLGAAIFLIGAGVVLAGAGLLAFSAGLVALSVGLTAAGTAIGLFVSGIIGLVPLIAKEIGVLIITVATVIGQGGPAILNAISAVLSALLEAIIKVVPLVAKAFGVVLTTVLGVITKYAGPIVSTMARLVITLLTTLTSKAPQFVAAAVGLVVAILTGIAKNVFRMVGAATSIVIAFIGAIGANTLRVVNAGINMVINLINGIANSINSHVGQLRQAGINLALAIINGMTFGVLNLGGGFLNSISNLASSGINLAKSVLGINSPSKEFAKIGEGVPEGFSLGVENKGHLVTNSIQNMGANAISSMQSALSGLGDLVTTNISAIQPTITPVLDLTKAQDGFSTLASMTKSQQLSVQASLNKALTISDQNAAAAAAIGQNGSSTTVLNYTQNNTSPVALDAATVYRQTKNQLSTVKGALPSGANSG